MMLLAPQLRDSIPEGFTVIERTPRNHVADIGRSATSPMFLAMRQRLASLEPLRPLPLVKISMQQQKQVPDGGDKKQVSRRKARMRAYYSTDGATIAFICRSLPYHRYPSFAQFEFCNDSSLSYSSVAEGAVGIHVYLFSSDVEDLFETDDDRTIYVFESFKSFLASCFYLSSPRGGDHSFAE
uniref:Uncharacterized protein n=3 Tax=Grammatophora oceanica TaxID=210454 RepID=A0A6U5MPP3_9STRA|mmetsp:Transcript_39770/g.58999  ORF Transcript_39770/g.58999 Transcript_39770/m.58999 type:complete len:183 (+) Transcript_39770:366-914(+)